MIRSFKDKETEKLFNGERSRSFQGIERVAIKKLMMLNEAEALKDLTVFPGNRLEPLKGDRQGQHSIRINDQWRICFVWTGEDADDVEITDYH